MLDPLRPSFGIRLDHLKTSVWKFHMTHLLNMLVPTFSQSISPNRNNSAMGAMINSKSKILETTKHNVGIKKNTNFCNFLGALLGWDFLSRLKSQDFQTWLGNPRELIYQLWKGAMVLRHFWLLKSSTMWSMCARNNIYTVYNISI